MNMQSIRSKQSFSLATAAVLIFFMISNLATFVLDFSGGVRGAASWIYFIFLAAIYALMVLTGKTSLFRRIFFVTFALLFVPSFMQNLIDARGSIALSESEVINNQTPFCHLVIPITLIPAALSRTIIFPARLSGHYAAVYSMLGIWLTATLMFGRGWCSWICFYGGWDEGFSRLAKKRKINLDNSGPKLRYFSFSMLIFIVLVSLATFSPVYCEWFCPFKAVTEFSEITDIKSYLATIVFIGLFLGLVIVMPILTKKRFQCAVFCPFGAFQSLVDKVSIYRIRIDKNKCTGCMACVKACPTLSLSKERILSDKDLPLLTCTKCGECISVCKNGAISYDYRHRLPQKWKEKSAALRLKLESSGKTSHKVFAYVLKTISELLSPAALFPFAAFTFGMVISSMFARDSIAQIITMITGIK